MQPLRRPPRACLRRRSPSHRAALLHELRLAEVRRAGRCGKRKDTGQKSGKDAEGAESRLVEGERQEGDGLRGRRTKVKESQARGRLNRAQGRPTRDAK